MTGCAVVTPSITPTPLFTEEAKGGGTQTLQINTLHASPMTTQILLQQAEEPKLTSPDM